ncbi:taste receptor type 1 member 1 [Taeniopygia guttata]|uniref:taste receptor type 1 member 1 n=1 Tax=Taeniopygia guttata TaxID=59729 RepID=UPI003BB912D8
MQPLCVCCHKIFRSQWAGLPSITAFSCFSTLGTGSTACPAPSLPRTGCLCHLLSGVQLPGAAHPPFPWLSLQISYEASTEALSLKRLYPSFLRTIPSDRQQVKAIFLLLQHFGWTWVVLLGSDNTYGRAGLDALQEMLTTSNVCVAYRGTIPANLDASNPKLHNLVRILTDVKVNVTVVFSTSRIVLPFFKVVVQRNITGMVWVASEDWSLSQRIWQVPGIQTIGTVFGMAVEKPESAMLERFEAWRMSDKGTVAECASSAKAGEESAGNVWLDCTQHCTSCPALATIPDMYDAQGSFNVYSAVYAVAHGLHDLLGCASGACSKGTVYPWQLLQKIKQVNFTLYNSRISFDAHGDIHKGYDIVMWKWLGPNWTSDVIGTFRVNPDRLSIDPGKVLWHTEDGQAPSSVCSEACEPGEMRLQQSHHKCCFSCVVCPPGTFLNTSGQYTTGSDHSPSSPAHILPPAPVSPFPASHLLWSVKPVSHPEGSGSGSCLLTSGYAKPMPCAFRGVLPTGEPTWANRASLPVARERGCPARQLFPAPHPLPGKFNRVVAFVPQMAHRASAL